MRKRWTRLALGAVAGGVLVSTAALALPWDVDMVDSQFVRGYECWEYEITEDGERQCVRGMQPLPQGVVSQPNMFSPAAAQTMGHDKMDIAAWTAMENPLDASSPEVQAKGEKMFRIYCTPCHGAPNADGVIENLGTVAQPGRMAGVVMLSGEGGVLQSRTDGQVYRAIRMGNAIMPPYNWAMNDDEMWSVVAYARTLDNGAYKPPPAPSEDEEADQ